MNALIVIFGDAYIKLDCENSECINEAEIPGRNVIPSPLANFSPLLITLMILGAVGLVVVVILTIKYYEKVDGAQNGGVYSMVPGDEAA